MGMGSRVGMGSWVGSYLGISGSGILHLVSLFKAEDRRWDAILKSNQSINFIYPRIYSVALKC